MTGALAQLEAARRAAAAADMVAASHHPSMGPDEEWGEEDEEEQEEEEDDDEVGEEGRGEDGGFGHGFGAQHWGARAGGSGARASGPLMPFPPIADFLSSFPPAAGASRSGPLAASSWMDAGAEGDDDDDGDDGFGDDEEEEEGGFVDDAPLGGDGDLVLTSGIEEEEEEEEEEDPWTLAAADQASFRVAMRPTVDALPTEALLWPSPSVAAAQLHKAQASSSLPHPVLPWGPLSARVLGLRAGAGGAAVAPQAFVGPFDLMGEEEEDELDDELEEEEGGEGVGMVDDDGCFVEAGGLLPSVVDGPLPVATARGGVRRRGQAGEEEGLYAGGALPDLTTAAGATRRAQRAGPFGPMRFAAHVFFHPPRSQQSHRPATGEGFVGEGVGSQTVRALMGDLMSVLDYRQHQQGEGEDGKEGDGDEGKK
jgi:hypothetical protein